MLRHLDVVAHGLRFYGALIGAATALGAVILAGATYLAGDPIGLFMMPFLLGFGGLFALPFIATGQGLLQGRPWARIAGIILSALIITDFPIGMSLGILGLGVLLDDEVARSFATDRSATSLLSSDGTRDLDEELRRVRAMSARIAAREVSG